MKSLDELKKELIYYGKIAGEKNFTPGYSGNLSARYGDKILITSSGSANGYLNKNELVLMDFQGNLIEGDKKPSSEKMLHAKFYEIRPDVNYIIHVHSPFLSTFACCHIPLDEPIMAENVFYFGEIPLAEYGLPSSKDLVDKTSVYFKDYNAVLMANHGFIVGDKTIKDAFLKLELAESYAQVVFNCKVLGNPVLFNKEQVNEIISLK
ncbi:class II aldolase/adducin family protein [bacterium]|nr:class II aldolase/adducin family protein [bacterium]